jgi:anti-sigma factor RsiW
MRLEGGSVGYLIDRKAAVVVYRLRRHVVTLVTLLVFRGDGLAVFLWRAGELGYALVADVDPLEPPRARPPRARPRGPSS